MLIKARHINVRDKLKSLKLVAFVDVIDLSRLNHGSYLVRIGYVMKYSNKMLLSNLETCKIKPAEQTLAKPYDPIGMTPLSFSGLICFVQGFIFLRHSLATWRLFCVPFHIKMDNFYTII